MGKGKRGRILVWVACPAGVGSSTIIKLQAEDVIKANGFGKQVEVEAVSDTLAKTEACDIVLCTLNIANRYAKSLSIPVVGMVNVMSAKEYEDKLIPVIRQILDQEE